MGAAAVLRFPMPATELRAAVTQACERPHTLGRRPRIQAPASNASGNGHAHGQRPIHRKWPLQRQWAFQRQRQCPCPLGRERVAPCDGSRRPAEDVPSRRLGTRPRPRRPDGPRRPRRPGRGRRRSARRSTWPRPSPRPGSIGPGRRRAGDRQEPDGPVDPPAGRPARPALPRGLLRRDRRAGPGARALRPAVRGRVLRAGRPAGPGPPGDPAPG